MVRENTIRAAVESNGYVLGARALSASPVMIDVYGTLNLDFVWLDTEHTGYSPYNSVMFNQFARTAQSVGLEPFVRLSDTDPAMIRNMLDAGIRTLLLPRVKTPEQLREAVKATRYSYAGDAGERGIGASYPNGWGANIDSYPTQADNSVLIGALIETESAVEHIDEILAVPELGFVFLGPVDLSISMGYPMETDHPAVEAAVERIRDACRAADIPMGEMASDAERAAEAIDSGASIIRVGDDVGAVRQTLSSRLDQITGLVE